MQPQEISIEVPSQGARRATGEGSNNGWQKPQRFSAQKKTEVVLRLLRGEALDLLSRELGVPAARITTWREAFLDAGQWAPVRMTNWWTIAGVSWRRRLSRVQATARCGRDCAIRAYARRPAGG